jgi:hypothetical protein
MRPACPRVVAAIVGSTTTTLCAVALATAAHAAEVRVLSPCVITAGDRPPNVPIAGTGFTPRAEVRVETDGYAASVDHPHADAAGTLHYDLLTPVGTYGPTDR